VENLHSNSTTSQLKKAKSPAATVVSATTVAMSSCNVHEAAYLAHAHPLTRSYPKIEQLRITKGKLEEMTKYLFAYKENTHYFCPVCGSGTFVDVNGEPSDYNKWGVNLRCVPEVIDWSKLTYREADGKRL
jgi:hypothetical protein